MNKKVAIIVLGYNHKEFLDGSLGSSLKQSYNNYSVYYIDNNSGDGSVDFVVTAYPDVCVVQNTVNYGFAKGCNRALKKVFKDGCDAAVLLNPDTVVDENFLSELVRTAYSRKDIAIAQPLIYLLKKGKKTNQYNTSGNKVHYAGFGYCGDYGQEDVVGEDAPIAYASGACFLVKRGAFAACNGFDEDFFLYVEDQDLGWRLRMLGYEIVVSARSKVWHSFEFNKDLAGAQKMFYLERNRIQFLIKNFSMSLLLIFFPVIVMLDIFVYIHAIVNGYFYEKLKSSMAVIVNIPSLFIKRRIIQKSRIVSDDVLVRYLSSDIDLYNQNDIFIRILNMFLGGYWSVCRFFFRFIL